MNTSIDTYIPDLGLDSLHAKNITGEISQDILALKEEIAAKYIQELKEKKSVGISSVMIGEGKSLQNYLVTKNVGDKILSKIKGGLMKQVFDQVDGSKFEIGGVSYNSIFDYLDPIKQKLDAANSIETLQALKSEVLINSGTTANSIVHEQRQATTIPKYESREISRSNYVYPIPGAKINSSVGERKILGIRNNKKHIHKGIDIPAKTGTSIVSIGDGVVESVGMGTRKSGFYGYGNYIVVKLSDGNRVLYGHMDTKAKNTSGKSRNVGDRIKSGEQVGLVGNTGTSTGSHLHLEIRKGTVEDTDLFASREYIDPISLLPVTKELVNEEILGRIDKSVLMQA